jgi:hypothetical protein
VKGDGRPAKFGGGEKLQGQTGYEGLVAAAIDQVQRLRTSAQGTLEANNRPPPERLQHHGDADGRGYARLIGACYTLSREARWFCMEKSINAPVSIPLVS